MITWCDKSYLKITSDIAPKTAVRKPLPSDDEETVEILEIIEDCDDYDDLIEPYEIDCNDF